jgi:hypothetical protein
MAEPASDHSDVNTCRHQMYRRRMTEAKARKNGISTALLFACLEDMRQHDFGYAIIGGVGPAPYYAKVVGTVTIEGSEPGIYRDLLQRRGGSGLRLGRSECILHHR